MNHCPLDECEEECTNLRSLVLHIRSSHRVLNNQIINCPVEECLGRFSSADAFRRHAEWRHRADYLDDSRQAKSTQLSRTSTDLQVNFVHDSVSACDILPRKNAASQYEDMMKRLGSKASMMRLIFEHQLNLPTLTARAVYEEALGFALSLCQQSGEVALSRLEELGVTDRNLIHYLANPCLEGALKSVREGSMATFQSLNYVEPQQIDLLNLATDMGRPQPEPEANAKRPVMHYVPILETLKSFISHSDVVSNILREELNPPCFSSFTSGSLYREHPLFSREPNALRITLYTDELELCNPIGGNNIKHKICCVYFQVGNVGTKHLSALQTIHLALLVKDSFKNQFGYDVVLRPLIRDLQVLAGEGVKVFVKGGGVLHFRGAVVSVCSDNLSSHHLGGFRRVFSSGKVCRWCMADYKNLAKIHSERVCQLRTAESMERHSNLVAQDTTLEPVYGIVGKSALLELPYVTLPDCLPADIMHDVYEKVLCLNVKAVLRGLHKSKGLEFKKVLELTTSFKFQAHDKLNKHPPLNPLLIRKSKSIRGSASQKRHLFYFLSLMIGPEVPRENEFWKLHLLLNRICDILFAISITDDMLKELDMCIEAHHKLWVKLVKGCYPPKLHYFFHYVRLIKKFGALRYQWCMRFEAFHQYIKRMSQKCNNFCNITKTMATRVQRKRCLQFSGVNALPPRIKICVKQQTVMIKSLEPVVQMAILEQIPHVSLTSLILKVSSVTCDGLLIKEKCFNILDVQNMKPIFLNVQSIFAVSEEVFACGRVTPAGRLDSHPNAYEVNLVGTIGACVPASKLYPAQTLCAYNVAGKDYIKLKMAPRQ